MLLGKVVTLVPKLPGVTGLPARGEHVGVGLGPVPLREQGPQWGQGRAAAGPAHLGLGASLAGHQGGALTGEEGNRRF